MAKSKFERFRNMSNNDLANYYVDVCAYREAAAVEEQKVIGKIMVERFVDKYADAICDGEDCEDFHLTDKNIMHKYFITFIHATYGNIGFGNIVFESNTKITDFDNVNDMQKWINEVQKWIEDYNSIENVIVMNFSLVG